MLGEVLLWFCAGLTVLLTVYSLGHYLCVLVFVAARTKTRTAFTGAPADAVAVLIPARHEGAAAVRVIQSVLAQDHRGPIEIYLLLKDRTDSALPFLAAAFPGARLEADEGALVELTSARDRKVTVVFTGEDDKSAKLNSMARRLTTAYLAILDCDHQAHEDWIRSSLQLMQTQGARIIQGRRSSISAHGLYRLWDALHQHIGCELFNAAFSRLGLPVFFTGTTVVMETTLLTEHPLRRCITEDADFSYEIVLRGVRIISNPLSGSDEELSPDLYSFLARRRRWANGHTRTFLRHLGRLAGAPISLSARVQFLFHGLHYLICVPVFLLHLVIGVILVRGFCLELTLLALLASLLVAALVVRTQRTAAWAAQIAELVVAGAWFFPAVVIVINSALAAIEGDIGRTALPFPGALQVLGLVGLGAPLWVLLCGLAGFRQLSAGSFLAVVLSYPIAFYLDICGVLIGIADAVAGLHVWRAVARAPHPLPSSPERSALAQLQLAPAFGIKDCWQLNTLFEPAQRPISYAIPLMMKPSRSIPVALSLSLIAGFAFCSPRRLEVTEASCQPLKHDGDPWIVPPNRLKSYCDPGSGEQTSRWQNAAGAFQLLRDDRLESVDPAFWDRLDTTFPCNLSMFSPDNVTPLPEGGVRLTLAAETKGDRSVTAGDLATKNTPDARFLYGRFETVMKPAKTSGVISAFFLYRFDPWQEIDAEFLGRDTTKMLLNVYYNPGEEGDLYNYGFAGTPVLVDLGFDAAADFHRYAIEWEPDEIRWLVDGRVIHTRQANRPTPIPHLPMRFHVNAWPTCGESLAGPFTIAELPKAAEVRQVALYRWSPSLSTRLASYVRSLFSSDDDAGEWREHAGWIQPGR